MIIIALNGPPSSGKDTVADALVEHLKTIADAPYARHFKIAERLKRTAMILMDQQDYHWRIWESRKDEIVSYAGNDMTYRDLLISVGDTLCGRFGRDMWTKLLLNEMNEEAEDVDPYNIPNFVAVISDLGFDEEYACLLSTDHYVFGIRLHREGTDFSNDSRDYISDQDGTVDFENNSNPKDVAIAIWNHVNAQLDS